MADGAAKLNVLNVLVMAGADGTISRPEKEYIYALCEKLGIETELLRELTSQFRENPRKLSLPSDPAELIEAIETLAGVAMADENLSDREHKLLKRVASYAGLSATRLEQILRDADPIDEGMLYSRIEEIYTGFSQWDPETRRTKVSELANMGRATLLAMLRILESYRKPDQMETMTELKSFVIAQLGLMGDDRAAYYLAQLLSLSDTDDEISTAQLRWTAAEALGKIVNEPFTPDQAGLDAARLWWRSEKAKQYDKLAY